MATISEMARRASAIDIREESMNVLIKTSDALVRLNQDQLNQGIDADQNELTPYSSIIYSLMKQNMYPDTKFGIPNLKLSGSFHSKMNLKVSGNEFEIDSSDSKSENLKSKYGDKIFGLSQTNKEYYTSNIFRPSLVNLIRDLTGLK